MVQRERSRTSPLIWRGAVALALGVVASTCAGGRPGGGGETAGTPGSAGSGPGAGGSIGAGGGAGSGQHRDVRPRAGRLATAHAAPVSQQRHRSAGRDGAPLDAIRGGQPAQRLCLDRRRAPRVLGRAHRGVRGLRARGRAQGARERRGPRRAAGLHARGRHRRRLHDPVPDQAGPARLAPSAHRRRGRRARRPRQADPDGAQGLLRRPRVRPRCAARIAALPLPRGARHSRRRESGRRRVQRHRARDAPVVLPVEHDARRHAPRRGRRAPAHEAGGLRGPGHAPARLAARHRRGEELLHGVLPPRRARHARAGPDHLPREHAHDRPRDARGDGAVHGGHRLRPQRRLPHDVRFARHLRERRAREALRPAGRRGHRLRARDVARRGAACGVSRSGVVPRPQRARHGDVADVPREVHPGDAAVPGDPAAAHERPGVAERRQHRQPDDAAEARGSPSGRALQDLPLGHWIRWAWRSRTSTRWAPPARPTSDRRSTPAAPSTG